jgi:hypothetical protein
MMLAVRALSLTSAVVHVALVAVAAFLMWFFAVFPFENQSAERAAADDWLLGAAPLIAVLAIAAGAATFARKARLVAAALTAEFAVGAVVLAYALGESDHSDGRLMLWALAIAGTGAMAGIATGRAEMTPGAAQGKL